MTPKELDNLIDSAIADGKIAEAKMVELRGKANEAGIGDEELQAAIRQRLALYEAQQAKGLFGLTYRTRVRIWTAIFVIAICIWIFRRCI